MRRVIWQDPAPPQTGYWLGVVLEEVQQGDPTKQSTGRGQGLTGMLVDSAGRAGRGQSTPSPPVGRSWTRGKMDKHSYQDQTSPSSHNAAALSGSCGYLLRGHLQATSES